VSRTIGRHWDRPRGDRAARCDYCGAYWHRSELVEDGAGLLRCPDEGNGLDATTLMNENARGASEYMGPRPSDGKGVPIPPHDTSDIVPLRTRIGGTF
jgi:hypothetical protein